MAYTASVQATTVITKNTADPTIAITTVSGDTLLVVMAYLDDTSEADVDAVPSDGDGDTYVEAHNFASGNLKCYVWYVVSPTIGAKTITINTAGSTDVAASAGTFQGTVHATPVGDVGDGSATSASLATGTGGNTMSALRDNSLLIAIFGQSNNSVVATSTYGTGQTQGGEAAAGGGEKIYSAWSYEIISATGTNEQTITMSKSAAGIVGAVEFQHADEAGGTRKILLIN